MNLEGSTHSDHDSPAQPSPDVGTRLLFENEQMRVWTLELGPGETWGPHQHTASYVTLCAAPAQVREVDQTGQTTRAFESSLDFVDWHDLSDSSEQRIHTLINEDERRYKNFIVELLDR